MRWLDRQVSIGRLRRNPLVDRRLRPSFPSRVSQMRICGPGRQECVRRRRPGARRSPIEVRRRAGYSRQSCYQRAPRSPTGRSDCRARESIRNHVESQYRRRPNRVGAGFGLLRRNGFRQPRRIHTKSCYLYTTVCIASRSFGAIISWLLGTIRLAAPSRIATRLVSCSVSASACSARSASGAASSVAKAAHYATTRQRPVDR